MTQTAADRFPLPGRLLVYGVRTAYAAEVAEILDRLEHRGVLYVDNLADGPDPAPVRPVIPSSGASVADIDGTFDSSMIGASYTASEPCQGHSALAEAE